MLVLGIDPGSRFTGYGLVTKNNGKLELVAAGRIKTTSGLPLAERLWQVFEGLQEVVNTYEPDQVSIEDVFYAKNIKTAVRLGHVRGVAMLAASAAGLPVFEYPPASIKMAVVGYGQADKAQVSLMVKKLLATDRILAIDASDALAAAICHLNQNPALRGMRP